MGADELASLLLLLFLVYASLFTGHLGLQGHHLERWTRSRHQGLPRRESIASLHRRLLDCRDNVP